MNKKIAYTIAMAAVASATTVFAAEETAQADTADIIKRLEALEGANKKSSWSEKVKIKGDLRYRFEVQKKDDDTSKNRQRIRARLGAYAEVNDFTTAGIRIRTGKDANSGNQTIGSDFDGKGVYLDLAYITLTPEDAKYGAATLGKMKYPWKATTDMIWDSDVNPEGLAYSYSTKVEETGLFGSAGYFKVDDTSSTHDLNLAALQAGIAQPLGEKSKATIGGSYFDYDNVTHFTDPDTDPAANYMVGYRIAEGFAEVGFKDVMPVPFKVYGNYVNNTARGSNNEGFCTGIKFGDAKKGKWEAKIGYRDLDLYAAPAYYADSDYADGGTDIKGVRVKAKYNICKNLQAGLTFIAGEQKNTNKADSSNTDVDTLHLDLIAKF